MISFRITATCFFVLALFGCSGGSVVTTTPAGSRTTQAAYGSSHKAVLEGSQLVTPVLYVLNAGGGNAIVTAYGGRGKTYLRSVDIGQFGPFDSLAFAADAQGHLYVSLHRDHQTADSILDIYSRGAGKLVRTLKQKPSFGELTFDVSGNLFTTCRIYACEYANAQQRLVRKIPASQLPFGTDLNGDVATTYYAGGIISVFAPGKIKPYWKTKEGTNYNLNALIFDASGNLYAENESTPYSNLHGSIAVYAPGGSVPTRAITDGIEFPVGIGFDPSGDLNVLNENAITIYSPGSSHPAREITQGVDAHPWAHPGAGLPFAIDSAGYLYVANQGVIGGSHSTPGSVTVYAPGTGKLIRTITATVQNPVALAVAP